MNFSFSILFISLFSFTQVVGQTIITGQVISTSDSTTIPGVTVKVKGGTVGTATDMDGKFSLAVPIDADTLQFSFIGFKSIDEAIAGRIQINVSMVENSEQLDEFVVTALGISKEKKALGYAVAEVKVDDMTKARDANVMNTISGKVAGVQVSKTSGGPGSSSRIVIRGNKSISKSNQPLFVVDGVPMDNENRGGAGMWGGIDYGSPISDINPDDIESVTILKGPNAAAIYGSRAAFGVVLITTKKGTSRNGIGVSFNSTTSFEFADIQKKFQNEYGAGTNGSFEYETQANGDSLPYFNTTHLAKSWGPKMEDQEYVDWDGVTRTYSAQPDNYKDFFQVGNTLTNSLSLDGGNELATFRLSYTNLKNRGIVPNTKFERNSVSLRTSAKLSKKLTADGKVNYIRQDAENRLNQADSRGAGRHYNFLPRNVSDESLQDYKDADGNEKVWYSPWAWQSNPYWVMNENQNKDWRDRIVGFASVNYQIFDWLSLNARTGLDTYNERRQNTTASGSKANSFGDHQESWLNFTERNTDFLFVADKKLSKKIGLSGNFGGNRMYQSFESISIRNQKLSIPGFYNVFYYDDVNDLTLNADNYGLTEKRINSLYGSLQIAYSNYLFLDFTGRNDWSSTLPVANNSYFYPSASLSFVITDALGMSSKLLEFAKIRGSYAKVGSDGNPYLTQVTYVQGGSFNAQPLFYTARTLALTDLKPEQTTSLELGADLRLLSSKINIDFTYYRSKSTNQIIPSFPVSAASGYSTAVINAGEIQNNGIELMLNLVPMEKKNLGWEVNFNFAKNQNKVVALAEGVDNLVLGEQWGATIEARPGNAYGDIVGYGIKRDDSGNKLVDQNGMYIRSDTTTVLGNINPDFLLGISNEVRYKSISLSFLIDMKIGGDIYSASNMYAHGYSGTVEQTLEGREEWYASEDARRAAGKTEAEWEATGGYLAEGVYEEGAEQNGENIGGQANETYVNPENYWGQFSNWGNEIHEPHVYDASYVKLREVSIGYQIPKKIVKKVKLNSASFSIVGRNLWLIYSGTPNIDPEAAYNNGNGQGVEYGTYPIARSIGFNINATF
ncbi:MAG: SusC/RagA family TonB-linked outer membrane protein [Flavobacteriales bacterium]|nr:SusC/RagA family TonB-linked outer membrane protein [Flavobacteriales bacterium]